MRVKVGTVALATADGYGIGLDEDGHLVEFMGDWVALDPLAEVLGGPEPVLEVADWAIIAIDGRTPNRFTRKGMVERGGVVKAELDR